MVKAILAMELRPGAKSEDYEKWLKEKHLAELLSIPGLRKLVFNNVKGVVAGDLRPFRIVEQHFDNMEAYKKSREWLEKNPISQSRGIFTNFLFFVVCEIEEIQVS